MDSPPFFLYPYCKGIKRWMQGKSDSGEESLACKIIRQSDWWECTFSHIRRTAYEQGDFSTLWRSCIGPPQPPYPASRDFPLFRGQNKASLRLPAVSYATPLTSTHSVFYIAGNAAYRRSHRHGVSYCLAPRTPPRHFVALSPSRGRKDVTSSSQREADSRQPPKRAAPWEGCSFCISWSYCCRTLMVWPCSCR